MKKTKVISFDLDGTLTDSVFAESVWLKEIPKAYAKKYNTTLEKAQNWAERLWVFSGKGKVPVVLLGNKVDLRKSLDMTLTAEQGQKVAEELSKSCQQAGFDVPYIETSAKTGRNVEDAFMLLAQNISEYIAAKLAS